MREPMHISAGRGLLAVALAGVVLMAAACENNAGTDSGRELSPREDFYLRPSAAEIKPGDDQAVFSVVGGQPPFTWSVEREALGSIAAASDRSAVYERKKAVKGVNTVTVRDAGVLRASASVIQD